MRALRVELEDDPCYPRSMELTGCLNLIFLPVSLSCLYPNMPRRLLSMPDRHLSEIPHDALPALVVNQIEKIRVDDLSGTVIQQATRSSGRVPNRSIGVEKEKGATGLPREGTARPT